MSHRVKTKTKKKKKALTALCVFCFFSFFQVGNLGLLFMLLFFIYAALGVELFGELGKCATQPATLLGAASRRAA